MTTRVLNSGWPRDGQPAANDDQSRQRRDKREGRVAVSPDFSWKPPRNMLRRLSKGLSVECDAFVAIDAVYQAFQSGRESVVWGYRRAFGDISCPTARTGPECARLCRKNVELDGEAALPEAELRELHAGLERFLRGSWRGAKLEKKSDAISRVARSIGKIGEMSLYR